MGGSKREKDPDGKKEKKKRKRSSSSSSSLGSKGRKKKGGGKRGKLEDVAIDELLAEKDRQLAEQRAHMEEEQKKETEAMALVPVNTAIALVPPPPVNPALASAAREARRIHVSNMPKGIADPLLRETFNSWAEILRRQMIQDETGKELSQDVRVDVDTVLDIFISTTSQPYAFVELNSDDMTSRFIQEDENIIMTSDDGETFKLKLRRPNNYRDLSAIEANRLVIVGAPDELSESQYRELLGIYGELTDFHFLPAKVCYVEFPDDDVVRRVINDLHGATIGTRVFVVRRLNVATRIQLQQLGINISVSTAEGLPAVAVAAEQRDAMREILNLDIALSKAVTALAEQHPHLAPLAGKMPIFPTNTLVLYNLIDEMELEDDDDYFNLLEDISEEIEKYGRVAQLIVPRHMPNPPQPPPPFAPPDLPPRPPQIVTLLPVATPLGGESTAAPEIPDTPQPSPEQQAYEQAVEQARHAKEAYETEVAAYREARKVWEADLRHPVKSGVGRVFVEYFSEDEAAFAQKSIAGKLFNGRTVVTSFLFDDILNPPPDDEKGDQHGDSSKVDSLLKDLDEGKAPTDNTTNQKSDKEPPNETAQLD